MTRRRRPSWSRSTAPAATAIAARPAGCRWRDGTSRRASAQRDLTEKMIRKLRAGMMPPAGARRPAPAQLARWSTALERGWTRSPARDPDPGWRPFQRLNRAEYAREIKHLLGLDVDVTAFLPRRHDQRRLRQRRRRADVLADVDGRLPARRQPHRDAGGRRSGRARPTQATFKLPKTASQLERVEGAPLGTRGGISVEHTFPADGDYVFSMDFFAEPLGLLFGSTRPGEKIEVSLDGARAGDLRHQPAHERREDRPDDQDRADAREGRLASRDRRVHPALRRADQRSDRADRSHDGRHRDRHRLRHHHAAAPAQPQHRRPAPGHRRVRHAEPPPGLHLPRRLSPAEENAVRRRHRPAPGDAGVPAPGDREGLTRG